MGASLTFGPFELDPDRDSLLRDGAAVPLGHRAAAVLAALVDGGGPDGRQSRAPRTGLAGYHRRGGQPHGADRGAAQGAGDDAGRPELDPDRAARGLPAAARAAPDGATLAAPNRRSLAVLPFRAVGGETEADYFADGVAEDIVTALSRFRSFTVLSSRRLLRLPGPRRRRPRGRTRARRCATCCGAASGGPATGCGSPPQLVEGETGAHLWAEHFDGAPADVFAFQDRITADVAMVIEPRIQAAEIARSRRERPGSIAAYDIYLQALPKIARQTAKENAEAYALLTEALAIEPDNALLLAEAAWALGHRNAMGWPPLGPDDARTITDLARRALSAPRGIRRSWRNAA